MQYRPATRRAGKRSLVVLLALVTFEMTFYLPLFLPFSFLFLFYLLFSLPVAHSKLLSLYVKGFFQVARLEGHKICDFGVDCRSATRENDPDTGDRKAWKRETEHFVVYLGCGFD